MKTTMKILTVLTGLTLLTGCPSSDPKNWAPSPKVESYEAHKPWGDNWHREHP
jgi:hypothetical protein